MARPRSPNRDKALQLWLKSEKKRLLKNIAEELGVSEEQIRKWKNQDQWDKVTLPNSNGNVTNHKGGQPGNKNAVGNKGGAAPKHNKNAIKTGEFETLFFDTLEPEERQMVSMVQLDKEQLLLQEIQLLTIRERRMMKRIEDLKMSVEYSEDQKPIDGFTAVSVKSGIEKGKPTELKEYHGKLGQIQSVEDALTRVQARRQKTIEMLHKFGYDDAHLELEAAKLDLILLKQNGEDGEIVEDGFMDAMNATAADVWSDSDE